MFLCGSFVGMNGISRTLCLCNSHEQDSAPEITAHGSTEGCMQLAPCVPSCIWPLVQEMATNQSRIRNSFLGRNIHPIRKILQRAGGGKNESGRHFASFFPYLPWKTPNSGKVGVYTGATPFGSQLVSEDADVESVLEFIMRIPPLLKAFEGYCCKALCIEVMSSSPPPSRLLFASLSVKTAWMGSLPKCI